MYDSFVMPPGGRYCLPGGELEGWPLDSGGL